MIRNKPGLRYALLLFFCCTCLFSCTKNVTKIYTVYFNDFEDFNLKTIQVSGWLNGVFGPVTDIRITDFNGNKMLGRFNSNLIDLKLSELPPHQLIRVEFDLYLHDKWKNDLWKMTCDGNDRLLTGFSNDSLTKQAYPNWLGNGTPLSVAGADAFNTGLPGACSLINSPHGTSMYKIIRTELHSDSTFHFNCSDAGEFFNLPCQRSWSIDNLKISIIKNN